tara:strand:+ start:12281 stop:12523 length:243 start_codon:yes stop_codon:yes gene_type:complete
MKCNFLHDKEGCIGCGVCAALDPENWEMEEEGKSHLKESEEQEGNEKKEFDEKELEKNKETAESCPVNVIHVYKDGKKII